MTNIIWEEPLIVKYARAKKHVCVVEEQECDHCGSKLYEMTCSCSWKATKNTEAQARREWQKHNREVQNWLRDHPEDDSN